MAIEDTIARIRSKPENVRVAYITGFVTVIMTFVVILWIFSIRENVRRASEAMDRSGVVNNAKSEIISIQGELQKSSAAAQQAVQQQAAMPAATRATGTTDAAPAPADVPRQEDAAPADDTLPEDAATPADNQR